MIIKNVLLAEDAGLGNGETPIFPIHIFKVKEGINYNPGDPNYDMFQLACKVSAKRLFPNFEFIDAPFNLQYYKEGDPDTEVATMGCVLGRETVKWRYKHTVGQVFHTSFTQFWNEVLKVSVPQLYGDSEYIVTTNLVEIYDSMHNGFVDCLKIIKRNSHNDWVKLKFGNGNTLICTTDHPLPVYNKDTETYTRTFVKDIAVGDCIPVAGSNDPMYKYANSATTSIVSITPMGPSSAPSYDVETSSDMFDVSGIVSHNCRTRVMGNVHDPNKQIVTGRGNLSFTSINLPRLAIEAKGDIDKFYKSLDDMVNLVIDQLKHRFKIQCAKRVENFPFLMGQGVWLDSENLDSMDSVGEVLKHGSLSVGFIGLAETLKCLIGVHHGESMKAQKLGIEIVTRMRHRLDEEAQKTKLNFTLLATPAESLSGRFVRMDAKKYGIIEGVTDRDYYTNSFHVPVYYNIGAFDKIKIEAPYHALTNAGHISYIEMDGDPTRNLKAFEKIVRCMKESGIGYGAINHPVDRDPVCGYTGIIYDECPCCHRHEGSENTSFERIRRITGYLSTDYRHFNNAKQAEVKDRVKHDI